MRLMLKPSGCSSAKKLPTNLFACVAAENVDELATLIWSGSFWSSSSAGAGDPVHRPRRRVGHAQHRLDAAEGHRWRGRRRRPPRSRSRPRERVDVSESSSVPWNFPLTSRCSDQSPSSPFVAVNCRLRTKPSKDSGSAGAGREIADPFGLRRSSSAAVDSSNRLISRLSSS